jgi:FtsP/CotA-like multicopper oxidase with cupredoxin domain
VKPRRARTFVFEAHPPAARPDGSLEAGSAGYWHYHDHCMGGDHGTEGIRKGLFGAFIVRRQGDPEPDLPPFVVVMGPGMTIGLLKAPDTPVFEAVEGQRVEFVAIAHGDLFHTFHLHGHRWVDNRTGIPGGPDDPSQLIDNRTIGPADSFGFQVIAGEGVGPGAWMYHCHVQGHSDAGMTGLFVVTRPDGSLTQAAREALHRWRDASRHL